MLLQEHALLSSLCIEHAELESAGMPLLQRQLILQDESRPQGQILKCILCDCVPLGGHGLSELQVSPQLPWLLIHMQGLLGKLASFYA